MTTTSINLPLYRVLKSLDVPEAEAEAQAAAEAAPPDLSQLATKEELRAEIAGVRAEIAGLETRMTRAIQQQTTRLFGALVAAVGVLIAAQRLMPQTLPSDAVRALVAQTVRDMQAAPAPSVPPR